MINVASYYHFDIEIHPEFPDRVAISMRKIIRGVTRNRDLIKNHEIFFPGMFVGDSQKLMLTKFLAI